MGRNYSDLPADERRARTSALLAASASDVDRWSQRENYAVKWAARARRAAQLISPPCNVLDLGCGARDLEGVLPLGCTYTGADLRPLDPCTIPCDLNAREVPDLDADVVTMLGVLNYIHDVGGLFSRLAKRYRRLVVSYNPAELGPGLDRRALGWFNDYRSDELEALISHAGYQVASTVTTDGECIYDLWRHGLADQPLNPPPAR